MPPEDTIAWALVPVVTTLRAFLHMVRFPFIIAAGLIAVSAIWAMAITIGITDGWPFVYALGRYAFYWLTSGLIIVAVRDIGNGEGQGTQREEHSASE